MFSKNLDNPGIFAKIEKALFSENDKKVNHVNKSKTKITPAIANSIFIFFNANIKPRANVPNAM